MLALVGGSLGWIPFESHTISVSHLMPAGLLLFLLIHFRRRSSAAQNYESTTAICDRALSCRNCTTLQALKHAVTDRAYNRSLIWLQCIGNVERPHYFALSN